MLIVYPFFKKIIDSIINIIDNLPLINEERINARKTFRIQKDW